MRVTVGRLTFNVPAVRWKRLKRHVRRSDRHKLVATLVTLMQHAYLYRHVLAVHGHLHMASILRGVCVCARVMGTIHLVAGRRGATRTC